ncbi:hypothetical protein [Clostridium tagluense]|uniref:Uncharacterized protein n=1 Tax=Clostridium tagluense TaxID=360422 RepID=A0A401UUE5_9CLOT|nr:hypothetical protein [Clostridium tagluense]GCD13161.1 hypothetical protein Ctaglu_47840 [Clostridium tagluense]
MNTNKAIDLLTKNYLSMCKAITLDDIDKEFEDIMDTQLECNDEEFISNEEIIETYIKALNRFL